MDTVASRVSYPSYLKNKTTGVSETDIRWLRVNRVKLYIPSSNKVVVHILSLMIADSCNSLSKSE